MLQKTVTECTSARWLLLAGTCILLCLPRATDWFALDDLRKTMFYFVLGMVLAIRDLAAWYPVGAGCWHSRRQYCCLQLHTTFANSVIACLMIGFVLHVGTWLPLQRINLFDAIERNSFTIFLLSWPAQSVAEVVLNKLLHLPVPLTMGLMFLAGIAVPLVCVKIVAWMDKRISMRWVKQIIGM